MKSSNILARLSSLAKCRLWHSWLPHGENYGDHRECADCGRREVMVRDFGGYSTGFWVPLAPQEQSIMPSARSSTAGAHRGTGGK